MITLEEFFKQDTIKAIYCKTYEQAQKLFWAFNKVGKHWNDNDTYNLFSKYCRGDYYYSNCGTFCSYKSSNFDEVYEFEEVILDNNCSSSTKPTSDNTIVDYNYGCSSEYVNGKECSFFTTIITYTDGAVVETKCSTENKNADQFTGFYVNVAKHAMGGDNTVNNQAEYWIKTKPEKDYKELLKREAKLAEQQRIEAKRKQRADEWRIRRAAIQRAEDYKAAKLAEEKYGVPSDWVK